MSYIISLDDILKIMLIVGKNNYPIWFASNNNYLDVSDRMDYVDELYQLILKELRKDYGDKAVQNVTYEDIDYVWGEYNNFLWEEIENYFL